MFQSGLPSVDWDDKLIKLGGHFLQSRAWAAVQEADHHPVVFAMEPDRWAALVSVKAAKGIKYGLLSYGPTVREGHEEVLTALREWGRQQRLDFIRLEPVGQITAEQLSRWGLRKISQMQPEHTWVLDLDRDESTLRSGLRSGHRNAINAAARKGIKIESSMNPGDLTEFLRMLDDTARRSKIRNHPEWYYRLLADTLFPLGKAKLYYAVHENQPVAGAIFYDFGGVRYYAHAGAFQKQNRQLQASVPLVWQAILDAKQDGATHFDFWGIAPTDDPRHPWSGITKFKQGFSGRQVDYSGTWDMPLKPMKYGLYGLYRKLKGLN